MSELKSKMIIEIIKTDNEIDWNISQLVMSESGTLVQVSKYQCDRHSETRFCGQDLSDGFYSKAWAKECFSKFTGKITIKND